MLSRTVTSLSMMLPVVMLSVKLSFCKILQLWTSCAGRHRLYCVIAVNWSCASR